jgi:abortive infection bacteriophage resistance protein
MIHSARSIQSSRIFELFLVLFKCISQANEEYQAGQAVKRINLKKKRTIAYIFVPVESITNRHG